MKNKKLYILVVLIVQLLACGTTLPLLPQFEGAQVDGIARVNFSWNGIPVSIVAEGECNEERCEAVVCAEILGFEKCEDFEDETLDE
jgi:hypothetical protein